MQFTEQDIVDHAQLVLLEGRDQPDLKVTRLWFRDEMRKEYPTLSILELVGLYDMFMGNEYWPPSHSLDTGERLSRK